MWSKNKIIRKIDKATQDILDKPQSLREHLGFSMLGKPCTRALWYHFYWVKYPVYPSNVVRLFRRGHNSEDRLLDYLEHIGCEVSRKDPKTNKQHTWSYLFGHAGGSCDALARGLGAKAQFIVECKTHKEKYFRQIVKHGMRESFPAHYVQCISMQFFAKKSLCLYLATNKNDDAIYCEWITRDDNAALSYIQRAKIIVYAKEPPLRISEKPDWYQCHPNFCNYRDVCYGEIDVLKNCRTCRYSAPKAEKTAQGHGMWVCKKMYSEIQTQPKKGCAKYRPKKCFI